MSLIYKGLNPKHHYGLCILTINGELITANGKHYQVIQIPKGFDYSVTKFIEAIQKAEDERRNNEHNT